MLSRIRQSPQINTYDTDYWHIGDPIPPLPPHEPQHQAYRLDITMLAQQQRAMPQWDLQWDEDSGYLVIQGLLYYTEHPYKYAPDHPRLVLPPQVREKVMKQAHLEVAHMAAMKTTHKLQEAFMWPAMLREVKQFVAKCPICIVHSKHKPRAPMGEMPLPKAPMQKVAADLIGPLVKTPQGNSYILTLIDHVTAWAEAYPLPNKTAKEVWNKLSKESLPRHSNPTSYSRTSGWNSAPRHSGIT